MNLIINISILVALILIIIQSLIIFLSDIETTKRRIFLFLDFIAAFVIYSGLLVWIAIVIQILLIPFIALFFVAYNIVLFRVVKKFVLTARLVRIKEEVNDALIDSLKDLFELDYKSAYEILEDALKRHPSSRELINLKAMFDRNLKKANITPEIKQVK